MFKIGFIAHSSGAVTPDVTPNAVYFEGMLADNTLAVSSGTYLYVGQQITGINVPIQLSLKTTLDPTKGHVYYQVANSFSIGAFQSNYGPLSGIYGTFNQIVGAVFPIPYNTTAATTFTVNPNQWLILAVDGTTAVTSAVNFVGELRNDSDSFALLSGLSFSYYNLQANYAAPLNFDSGPGYDSNNDPSLFFYSSSAQVTGIFPSGNKIDIDIQYADPNWDIVATLYYKVTASPYAHQAQWYTVDPAAEGFTPITSGGKIFNVGNGDYITFAVGGKTTVGNVNMNVDINNVTSATNQLLATFSAYANVTPTP